MKIWASAFGGFIVASTANPFYEDSEVARILFRAGALVIGLAVVSMLASQRPSRPHHLLPFTPLAASISETRASPRDEQVFMAASWRIE